MTVEAQAHVHQVEKNLTAHAQQYVRQVENNLTHRAEEAVRQKVVQAEAAITGAEMVVYKERNDKEAATLMAQQSQRRVLELEDAATKGNEYVHDLQQQATAHGQSTNQKIQALECSHKALQDEKDRILEIARQQERALLKRIADMENRELERAHKIYEASEGATDAKFQSTSGSGSVSL